MFVKNYALVVPGYTQAFRREIPFPAKVDFTGRRNKKEDY